MISHKACRSALSVLWAAHNEAGRLHRRKAGNSPPAGHRNTRGCAIATGTLNVLPAVTMSNRCRALGPRSVPKTRANVMASPVYAMAPPYAARCSRGTANGTYRVRQMARTFCCGRCTCNLDERQDTEHCRTSARQPHRHKAGANNSNTGSLHGAHSWRAQRAPQLRATATAVESPVWGPPRPPHTNQTRHVARHHGTGEDRRGCGLHDT